MPNSPLKKFSLLADPLTHFAVLGALVFAAYQWLNPSLGQDRERVIVVDEASLLAFVQYRSKQFDAQQTLNRLRAMDVDARAELIDEFVAEEALYRSAKKFGLEADDYVIRRRLVQKMDFMAEGVTTPDMVVDEALLQTFYAQNLERYFKPATVTFTHVFFSSSNRDSREPQALAKATLATLQQGSVNFTQAPQYGERFVYQLNYVERPYEEVVDHFGERMAQALSMVPARAGQWVGPIESIHGSHLVMVTEQKTGYQPKLAAVIDSVQQDYLAELQQTRRRVFAQEIIDSYELRIDPVLAGPNAS